MFFDFFKRAKKTEEVKFSELRKWLNESSYVKKALSEFQNEFQEYILQLNEALGRIQFALEKLRRVNLKERKVDEKIKYIVLQNKENYIKHVQNLVGKLRKELELKPQSFIETEKFIQAVSEHLDVFSKQSFRAFHIASELIGHELEEIVREISIVSSSIEKIKNIDKKKIKTIIQVKNCLDEIEENEKMLSILRAELANKHEEKHKIEQNLVEAEKRNQEIKASTEWLEKQNLISNITSLNEKLRMNESEVLTLFLSLEKVLKKWAWKEKNDQVLLYLENPLAAIKKDSNFEIISILSEIKEDIEQNKLELDEKRKKQFLKIISEISQEKLTSFIEKEKQLINAIRECEFELNQRNIELIALTPLIIQKNNLVTEIEKFEKKQKNFEQAILDKKKEIEISLALMGISLIMK